MIKDTFINHNKITDTLIGLLKDLDNARTLPGSDLEMHHLLDYYAKEIHRLYVDAFDKLMKPE